MKIFTYNDYIKAIHSLRLNEIYKVAEEKATYQNKKESKEKNKEEEKQIKIILSEKEEIEKIINTYLVGNEKIKATDLERYKIKKYKAKTSDIIYKMKEKEKYYIVEYIEEIDETMPYRILNNCIDIIYEWSKNARFKNDINYPIVVPIVIYAGKGKWKKINKENINTIGAKVIENHEIEVKYNLIDINIITEEFLSEQKSLFRTRND